MAITIALWLIVGLLLAIALGLDKELQKIQNTLESIDSKLDSTSDDD